MLEPAPRCQVTFDQALHTLAAIETKLPRVREKNARDGWLDGVRVLDLCNVIARPHSASYLARFGAEVIKLDPSKPTYDCWNTVIFGISHMRGKRSMLADIYSPEGRIIFEKLVKSVDVIVWNAPDRQVKAMELNVESLEKLNPNAIFCKLDCFSGPRPGPRTGYLGYDDLSRFYCTSSDAFLLLSAYESDTERFDNVQGLEGFSDVPQENRAAFLSLAFMSARASDWVERLQAADIAAAICENIDSIRTYNSRPAD